MLPKTQKNEITNASNPIKNIFLIMFEFFPTLIPIVNNKIYIVYSNTFLKTFIQKNFFLKIQPIKKPTINNKNR